MFFYLLNYSSSINRNIDDLILFKFLINPTGNCILSTLCKHPNVQIATQSLIFLNIGFRPSQLGTAQNLPYLLNFMEKSTHKSIQAVILMIIATHFHAMTIPGCPPWLHVEVSLPKGVTPSILVKDVAKEEFLEQAFKVFSENSESQSWYRLNVILLFVLPVILASNRKYLPLAIKSGFPETIEVKCREIYENLGGKKWTEVLNKWLFPVDRTD